MRGPHSDLQRRELIALFQGTPGAISRREAHEEPFTLRSGRKSYHYVNCRRVLATARGMGLVTSLLFDSIVKRLPSGKPPSMLYLGATGHGGMPLVGGMLERCYACQYDYRSFTVREAPKGHGTKEIIEGLIGNDGPIFLLEDVVTTGSSALHMLKAVADAGHFIDSVHVIVDRGDEGGVEAIQDKTGVPVFSLLTLGDLFPPRADPIPRQAAPVSCCE